MRLPDHGSAADSSPLGKLIGWLVAMAVLGAMFYVTWRLFDADRTWWGWLVGAVVTSMAAQEVGLDAPGHRRALVAIVGALVAAGAHWAFLGSTGLEVLWEAPPTGDDSAVAESTESDDESKETPPDRTGDAPSAGTIGDPNRSSTDGTVEDSSSPGAVAEQGELDGGKSIDMELETRPDGSKVGRVKMTMPVAAPTKRRFADDAPNGFQCADQVRPDADVGVAVDGFTADAWRGTLHDVLEARYPSASWVIDSLEDPAHFDVWFQDRSGWDKVVLSASTGVHEGVHIVGFQKMTHDRYSYLIGTDEWITIKQVETFPRKRILDVLPEPLADLSYNETYLEGDGAEQDLESVLDEFNAYTWSLYTAIALADQTPPRMRQSSRDGLLAFMIYLDRYLHLARTQEPDDYEEITGDAELVTAILTLWDRGRCVLALSGDDPALGLRDAELTRYVFGPGSLGELDRLR